MIVEPLRDRDVAEAAVFCTTYFRPELRHDGANLDQWVRVISPGWSSPQPHHGFLLRDEERIVGIQIAYYSERVRPSGTVRLCNLGGWFVLPEYRVHSLRLLREALRQPGHTVTDLCPTWPVFEIDRRLGFQALDTRAVRVVNLPWPARAGGPRIYRRPADIERHLSGADLRAYLDHRYLPRLRHLAVVADGRACYVVFRRHKRSGIKRIGELLHVSDPEVFRGAARHVFSHFLTRHGLLFTHLEVRTIGFTPRRSLPALAQHRAVRPAADSDGSVDYLYSELMFSELYL